MSASAPGGTLRLAGTPRAPKDGREQVRGQRYPITKSGFASAWRRHGPKAARITDFRIHDLRHTAGTRLLRAAAISS